MSAQPHIPHDLDGRPPLVVIRDAAAERADFWASEIGRLTAQHDFAAAKGWRYRANNIADDLSIARRNLAHHRAAVVECERRIHETDCEVK
jgi:hypothetical protein